MSWEFTNYDESFIVYLGNLTLIASHRIFSVLRHCAYTDKFPFLPPFQYRLLLSVLMLLFSLGSIFTNHSDFRRNTQLGWNIRSAVTSQIYNRILCSSSNKIQKITTGKLLNLMTNDVMRFETFCIFSHSLLITPFVLVAIGIQISMQFNWKFSLLVLGAAFALCIIQVMNMKLQDVELLISKELREFYFGIVLVLQRFYTPGFVFD